MQHDTPTQLALRRVAKHVVTHACLACSLTLSGSCRRGRAATRLLSDLLHQPAVFGSCLDVQNFLHRAPGWPLADLSHNRRFAEPVNPVLCALSGLQLLQLDVLAHQPDDLVKRLRQQSSIVCAQAGLLQLLGRQLIFA